MEGGPIARWHRSRLAIAGGFLLFGISAALWLSHIPVVTRRLDLEPAILGAILFGSTFVSLIANLFLGAVTTRFGSGRVSTIGLIGFMISVPLTIAAPNIVLLIAAAVAAGLFAAAANIALSTQAAAFEEASRLPVMSWFHAMFSGGGIFGALLGAAVIRQGWGDGSGAGVIIAAGVLAMLLGARAFLPDHASLKQQGSLWAAMLHPVMLLFGVIVFCGDFAESTMNDWAALFLATVRDLTESQAAVGIACYSAGIAGARLIGGMLVSRFGPRNVLAGGGALIMLGTALLTLVPVASIGVLGMVLIAFGGANIVPVMMSRAAQAGHAPPATAIAALTMAQAGGFLVSPVVVGGVAQLFGLGTGLSVLYAIGAGAIVTTMIALRGALPCGR